MKLTVVLGTSDTVSFDIELNDTPFVNKWVKELSWCLDNCKINQQEAFSGFLTPTEAANRLSSACVIINGYLKNFIEIRTDLLDQPQDYFNYLHQKFEKLSGEFGKPTRLFSIAKNELRSAIRDLNFYIHCTERKTSSDSLYISFDKDQYRRHHLDTEDYDYYEFETEPGSLILHYVELGKTFYDLYKDGLSIDYAGLKNLHYYSGEASLLFKKFSMSSDYKFMSWLKQHSINPYNKTLGIGKICLGKVVNLSDAYSKIQSNQHINKIIIRN